MQLIAYVKQFQNIWNHPSNQNKRIEAILRSLKWWFGARRNKRAIQVNVFGYKMKLHPDAFLTRGIVFFTPLVDYHIMNFVQRYLRSGDSFIDIGANIGLYTLLASSLVGESGEVSSFEPVPTTVKLLRENVYQNNLPQVAVHPIALGEVTGLVTFTSDYDAVNHIHTFEKSALENYVDVPCYRLDEILANKKYAMAKIDVEGWELAVLKGAESMLSCHKIPVLAVEINGSSNRYGIHHSDLINYLKDLGYDSAIYNADLNKLVFTNDVWNDVIFISREHRSWVIERISS